MIKCTVIKHFLLLSQIAWLKNNKSFGSLIQYRSNAFMIVKFNVLKGLVSKLNALLVKFQTDSPMIPFMSDVLEVLPHSFMKRFVLTAKLEEANTSYKLIKLDLDCQEIFCQLIKCELECNPLIFS